MLSLVKLTAQTVSKLNGRFHRSNSCFFGSAAKKPKQPAQGLMSNKKPKTSSSLSQSPTNHTQKKSTIATSLNTEHKKTSVLAQEIAKDKITEEETIPKMDIISKFRRERVDLIISKLENKQYNDLHFPIDFSGTLRRQPEKSMNSPVSLKKLIKYETIVSLYKTFFDCCTDNSLELYKEQFEPYFFDRVQAYLTAFEETNYQLKLRKTTKLRNETVDLFNVNMILGIGVSTNRKANDSIENYEVYNQIYQDCPMTTVMKSQPVENQIAIMKFQLDFNVRSPLYFELVKDGKAVLTYNTQSGEFWHHMKLEGDVLEIPETMLLRFIASKGSLSEIVISECKDLTNNIRWNIIDFDNFLNGNPLIEQGLKW